VSSVFRPADGAKPVPPKEYVPIRSVELLMLVMRLQGMT
jgi:hypothetical protein